MITLVSDRKGRGRRTYGHLKLALYMLFVGDGVYGVTQARETLNTSSTNIHVWLQELFLTGIIASYEWHHTYFRVKFPPMRYPVEKA